MSEALTLKSEEFNSTDQTEINLFEWLIAIGEEKKIIIVVTALFLFTSIIYSLTATPIYTSRAVIMIPSNNQSSQGNASILKDLNIITSIKSQEELYISLLQTDVLQNALIKKLELQKLFKTEFLVDTRLILRNMTRVSTDKKSNFIIIEVDNNSPEFSAILANEHVVELEKLISEISLKTARQQLTYYEDAISKTQLELMKAQTKLKAVKEKSAELSNSMLTESTYSQISNKELEVKIMKHFLTDQNPDIRRIEAELQELRERLFKSKPENSMSKKNENSNQVAVEAYREIKSLEMILTGLTSQYKSTAMSIFSNKTIIQIVEAASAPERRTKPKRTIIVITSTLIGMFAGFILSCFKVLLNIESKKTKSTFQLYRLRKAWFY